MIIMNYVACVPVLLIVGGFRYSDFSEYSRLATNAIFSLYHFYTLLGNTTTIEGWEKDKISVMVKKGEAREVQLVFVACIAE
jgi:palmitoyltransferase